MCSTVGNGCGGGVKMEVEAEVEAEAEAEACCVCGRRDVELCAADELDADAGAAEAGDGERVTLRAMLLHLNNYKVVPSGRLCAGCVRRTEEAYSFSQALAARAPPPLSEKIRTLRKRLAELTEKIDVFIVVGGAGGGAGGAYSEDDVIMVERGALRGGAAGAGPAARLQCAHCPAAFAGAAGLRAHAAAHGAGAAHWCWACGARLRSADELRAHAALHAAPDPLHCRLCDARLASAGAARRHEAACPSACPACARVLPSRAALRAHAAEHAALCPACFLLCESPAARTAHAAQHAAAQHFVCGYRACILRFTTRSSLMAHIRKCHGGEEREEPPAPAPASTPAPASAVACAHCPRTFGSTAAMKRHARTHQDKEIQDAEWQVPETEERVEYLEVEALEDAEQAAPEE